MLLLDISTIEYKIKITKIYHYYTKCNTFYLNKTNPNIINIEKGLYIKFKTN